MQGLILLLETFTIILVYLLIIKHARIDVITNALNCKQQTNLLQLINCKVNIQQISRTI